jgi:hypothetical protein
MSALPSTIPPDGAFREPPLSGDAAGRLRASPWFSIIGLALIIALPVLLPPVLPLADLGGHLGRYAIQLDGGRDPVLAQWYSFRWLLIPNLGVDLLVQWLGPVIGLEPAVRAIVFATAFLQAFGILAVSRIVHNRITPFAIFALPLVYARSFLYGFLNYTLALGLLWCGLALWIAMSKAGAFRRRWLVFALIATILWTCHLVGWALLCIAAGSQELIRQHERKGALVPATVASIGPLSCLLAPWAVKLLIFQPSTGSGHTEGFFHMVEKIGEVFQVFEDRWFLLDIVSAQIVVLVIAWSWLAGRARLNCGLALAAAATAVCVIVVPQRLLGSFYADQRLVEPALLFALLAIEVPDRPRGRFRHALFFVAILFAGARLTGSAVSLWQLGNRAAGDLTVIEALPRNARMVTFRAVGCPPATPWMFDRRTHLGGYALARHHAFSNDQWDLPGGQLLEVHNPEVGEFATDGSVLTFETPCGFKPGVAAKAALVPAAVTYLWVIWSGQPRPLTDWEPIARNGGSVLYRRPGVRSEAAAR